MTERLPDELTFGFVADRILKAVGDTTADLDRYPDGVPAYGTVRFTPMVRHLFTQSDPATVSVANIECTINPGHDDPAQTGLLVDPAGHTGNVALVVGWYQVSYLLEGESPDRFTIQVKPEHTNEEPLWLPRARELKPQPSERFVVNEQVYKDTLAARDDAEQSASAAATSETNSATSATSADTSATTAADILAATQALGITVDTSVGTRIFVGDTMIYGDTGWRDISNLLNEDWVVNRNFLMRRENSTITLVASIRRASNVPERQLSHQIDLLNTEDSRLPRGFRPYIDYNYFGSAQTHQGVAISLSAVGHRDNLQLRSLGAPLSATISPGEALSFTTYWQTNDSWPTSLPGVPS